MHRYDLLVPLVLIGSCSVGKTSFAQKISRGEFYEPYNATIGIEYASKTLHLDSDIVKCQIWDTAGQEKFTSLIRTYYKNVAGCILMYDVTNRRSFNKLYFWLNEIKQHGPEYPIEILLIGNKVDRENREVSEVEAELFARQNNLLYKETSVKNSDNLQEILHILTNAILKNKKKNLGVKIGPPVREIIPKEEQTKECCCIS